MSGAVEVCRGRKMWSAAGRGAVAGMIGVAAMIIAEKIDKAWPRRERLIDVLHKSVYSLATAVVADRLIRPELESHAGRKSH